MNIQWKNLITCLAIPLAVGSLSSLLTRSSMETFEAISKPALAPPGFLFPVVWTILYILMGIASYLVLTSGRPNDTALTVYGIQLAFNFFWPIIFFQSGAVPVCLSLACTAVAADSYNSRSVLSNIKTRRVSDASVSAMGNLCGVLKPFHLSVKLTKTTIDARLHRRVRISMAVFLYL